MVNRLSITEPPCRAATADQNGEPSREQHGSITEQSKGQQGKGKKRNRRPEFSGMDDHICNLVEKKQGSVNSNHL